MDRNQLRAVAPAAHDREVTWCEFQLPGQQLQQRGIGLAIDRHRGDANFQGPTTASVFDHAGNPFGCGARRQTDSETQAILRRGKGQPIRAGAAQRTKKENSS